MIVIACNTVNATCLEELRKRHKDIPIIGIIEPAAYEIAQNCNSGNNIGVIGTKATVKSRAYDIYISKYKTDLKIYLGEISDLVIQICGESLDKRSAS